MRLSSDYIFHYKQSFEVLQLILQSGFRHNLWKEGIPYKESKQLNFICCFCDIRPRDAKYHRKCYGKVAIALKKQWGVRTGISPVRYIHERSPGVSSNYIALKNMFRGAETFRELDTAAVIKMYLLYSMLHQKKLLIEGDFEGTVANDPTDAYALTKRESQFDSFLESIPTNEGKTDFIEFLSNMFERVADLHNELEVRDSFMRAYREDFTPSHGETIKNKILYDEKEWRSVRTVMPKEDGTHLPVYQKACTDKFLPTEYNLLFGNDDVAYIVVETEKQRGDLLAHLGKNDCLIDAKTSAPKVVTFDELEKIDEG